MFQGTTNELQGAPIVNTTTRPKLALRLPLARVKKQRDIVDGSITT